MTIPIAPQRSGPAATRLGETGRDRLEAVFRRYGLSGRILFLCDNGPPQGSAGNGKRPHEALAMETPATRPRMSQWSLPDGIPPPEYASHATV